MFRSPTLRIRPSALSFNIGPVQLTDRYTHLLGKDSHRLPGVRIELFTELGEFLPGPTNDPGGGCRLGFARGARPNSLRPLGRRVPRKRALERSLS